MTVEHIAEKIQWIIDSQVKEATPRDNYKTMFEMLEKELDSRLEDAQETMQAFDDNNFTVSRIDYEGYTRGLLLIKDEIEEIRRLYAPKDKK